MRCNHTKSKYTKIFRRYFLYVEQTYDKFFDWNYQIKYLNYFKMIIYRFNDIDCWTKRLNFLLIRTRYLNLIIYNINILSTLNNEKKTFRRLLVFWHSFPHYISIMDWTNRWYLILYKNRNEGYSVHFVFFISF